ncbi:Four helix bundle sensory module for signal transduction [Flexibacter flexilis DSM 6793]|uniref:Four helix bundle sensory module for signal transduction n=1 Tax=Flexibacter flexilis DSM 6793 TaxID=927664 RepID=A0A1I1H3S8_9BACT|nr:MCP four helix bundle domain-containing protein [Flexibacter flexilis]SFC18385.1 Four helix bundle sensory module for signal transduction [Flexibacter flexilis DSM 6793]
MQFPSNSAARRILNSFGIIFGLMLITGAMGSFGIYKTNDSFREMYERRLVPAMDISHIIEKQYQNRFHLEEHISGISIENYTELENDIAQNNAQVDSMINHYADGGNVLDAVEAQELKKYRNAIRSYRLLEKEILQLSRQNQKQIAAELFTKKTYPAFQAAVRPMERLEDDQVLLGKQLYQKTETSVSNIRTGLFVAIAVGLVVGIVLALVVSREYIS